MFLVRNGNNEIVCESITFVEAKQRAQEMHRVDRNYGFKTGPFTVYEAKEVWVATTLDEAIAASGIEK